MNLYEQLIYAFDLIPLVREGKGDIGALGSFSSDVRMFVAMKNKCLTYPSLANKYLREWQYYMKLRNEEDFVPHCESKYLLEYKVLFQ